MSRLKITTRTGAAVNPAFCEAFVKIAETKRPAIILTTMSPLLDTMTDEKMQEYRDIQHMAMFMALTGSLLSYRDSDYRFYFGDVDLMDSIECSHEDLTILQHELEDEKINVDEITTAQFRNVLQAFGEIDRDCMRDGADSMPFSDTEYYAEQIVNIFDLEEADALKLADMMRKFVVFQESGKAVPDLEKYTDAYGDDPAAPRPGRVYLVDPEDKVGLIIESTKTWDDEHRTHAWHLLIANQEWMSDDLEELEVELFDFALSAGWCDDL
jgi:hypothetical protein